LNDVGAGILGRNHNDGKIDDRMSLADSLENVKAGDTRHHDVEQHQMKLLSRQRPKGLVSPPRNRYVESSGLQSARQHVAIHGIVINQQNGRLRESAWTVECSKLHGFRKSYFTCWRDRQWQRDIDWKCFIQQVD